ncbi:MAG: zinc ribbon domain-containing protein [Lachnospira sp.]|nr:zinc ribbon domain-containing protein [Lachnospira sp.]
MKKCTECGKEYDEDMNFCPYCGIVNEEKNAELGDASDEPNQEEASAEQEDTLQEETEGEAFEEDEEPTEEELKAALEAAKAAGESKRIKKEMSETSDEEEETGAELPKNKLPMIIGITVIVGILIIAGVIVAIYYGTNKSGASEEYTKVVEEYMLGYQNKDVNRIMNTYPQFMRDNILSNSTPEDIWADIDKSFSETLGDDWKATYTMGAVATISDSDITALKSDLQSTYNTTLDFTSGYWVAADMTLTGKGDSSTMPLIFAVVQVDGKWAIVYQTYNTTGTGSSSQGQGSSVTEGTGQGSATE